MTPNATGLTGRQRAKRDGYRAAQLLGGPVEALVGRLAIHSRIPSQITASVAVATTGDITRGQNEPWRYWSAARS